MVDVSMAGRGENGQKIASDILNIRKQKDSQQSGISYRQSNYYSRGKRVAAIKLVDLFLAPRRLYRIHAGLLSVHESFAANLSRRHLQETQ